MDVSTLPGPDILMLVWSDNRNLAKLELGSSLGSCTSGLTIISLLLVSFGLGSLDTVSTPGPVTWSARMGPVEVSTIPKARIIATCFFLNFIFSSIGYI